MKSWWAGLSGRERLLLQIAGALAFVVGFAFLLVIPAQDRADLARDRLERALAVHARVQQAALVWRHTPRDGTPTDARIVSTPEGFKTAVTELSARRGLVIARLQTGARGEVSLVFDPVAPEAVFGWLEDVEAGLGARTLRLSMEPGEGGLVRVSAELAPGGQG
jgi:general secretion pathway protein M